MWEKIKKVFAVIGAFLTVIIFTLLLILLRKGNSDGSGSTGTDESDSRIREGLADSEERIARCEERLRRAEEILRKATDRSREENEGI